MHPHPRPFTYQLFLDFRAILFPEWLLDFFVSTIHQVIWPSPGTLLVFQVSCLMSCVSYLWCLVSRFSTLSCLLFLSSGISHFSRLSCPSCLLSCVFCLWGFRSSYLVSLMFECLSSLLSFVSDIFASDQPNEDSFHYIYMKIYVNMCTHIYL